MAEGDRQVRQVGGIDVAFTRAGVGDTVLLLHGGMSSADEWRRLSRLLPDADLVAWDCPGGGRSGDPREDWTLADFAGCAAGLLDALDVESAHVVGLSFGGGLALELWRQRPDLVRSLALLSAYAGWAGSLPEAEVRARWEGCLAAAESPGPPSREEARDFVGPDAAPDVLDELVRLEVDTRPVAYRVAGTAFARADLRAVLPTVAVPTVVVHGSADRRATRPVAEALHRGVPGAELLVLEGVGHCVDLEAPEAVAVALRRLWATCPPR